MENVETSGGHHPAYDTDSLPSYTLVSGLPSYDDALECYRKVQGSTSARPSLMKLFSFDNQLMSSQVKDVSPGELQQVVVVVDNLTKDGLPSYQEAASAVVANEKRKTGVKRSVHRPMLPMKLKDLSATYSDDGSATPSSAEEGTSLKSKFNFVPQGGKKANGGALLPQIHKSPSLVLMYDDDYWRNVHHQQDNRLGDNSDAPKLVPSYSSNSLPRNFSTHLANEC